MSYNFAAHSEVNYCYPTTMSPICEYNYNYLLQVQNQALNYNPGNLMYYPPTYQVNFWSAVENLDHIQAYQSQVPDYLPTPNENDYCGINQDDIQNIPEYPTNGDQIYFEKIERTSLKKESNEILCEGDYGAFKRKLDGNLKFFRLDGIEPKGFFLSGNIVMNSRTKERPEQPKSSIIKTINH